jgi:hypothetical protein
MSETAVEKRAPPRPYRRPVKAWIFAALLFAFGVRMLAARDR